MKFSQHIGNCCGVKQTSLTVRSNLDKLEELLRQCANADTRNETSIRMNGMRYPVANERGAQLLKFKLSNNVDHERVFNLVRELNCAYAITKPNKSGYVLYFSPRPQSQIDYGLNPVTLSEIEPTMSLPRVTNGVAYGFHSFLQYQMTARNFNALSTVLRRAHEAILTQNQLGSSGIRVMNMSGFTPAINWVNSNTGARLTLFTKERMLIENGGFSQ